jgi:hypothetical protein
MGDMAHPMGYKSSRFSSFLLKLRKEADDREAPGVVPAFPYFLALL